MSCDGVLCVGVEFEQAVRGMERYDICRLFLATLQLVSPTYHSQHIECTEQLTPITSLMRWLAVLCCACQANNGNVDIVPSTLSSGGSSVASDDSPEVGSSLAVKVLNPTQRIPTEIMARLKRGRGVEELGDETDGRAGGKQSRVERVKEVEEEEEEEEEEVRTRRRKVRSRRALQPILVDSPQPQQSRGGRRKLRRADA